MGPRIALVVPLVMGALGCESGDVRTKRSEQPREAPNAAAKPSVDGKKLYGAPISNGAAAELADVLKSPERYAGKNLVVSGHVRRACTRMGCWMEIAAGTDPATPSCRVFFHGHGFFVPKDSAGSDARVEGRFEVVTVSPAHAAHLEEEGARIPEKAEDGSAREVRLVASGVELYRRGG
jgi:hypothetical protein